MQSAFRVYRELLMFSSLKFATAVLLISLGAANAGPFGVDMGAPIERLDVEKVENKFSFRSVPKPHPLFSVYSGWQTAKHGVCRVVAISDTIENDSFGSEVRDRFDQIKLALSQKYGEARVIEGLQPGSIWDEPRDWTMSIFQNERMHAADWESAKADGEAYSLIQMWIVGFSSSDSAIALEYRSTNFDDCSAEIEAELNEAF